jgi:membrane-bound lytic murein transglycosylase D
MSADLAYYAVRAGDSLAAIALQAGVDPDELMRLNGLTDADRIYEGQHLQLPTSSGAAVAALQETAQAEEEQRQDEAENLPSADPLDYAVDASGRVAVLAGETVGHYADWLGVSAGSLRVRNGLKRTNAVLVGQKVQLDFARVPREQFEQRRREYHHRLQADYFATHRIVGNQAYRAKRGDSLWSVTVRSSVPAWLVQQYNPDIDFRDLKPGTAIVLPVVEAGG